MSVGAEGSTGAQGTPVEPQQQGAPGGQGAQQSTPSQTPSDWTTGFNDDLKGYVQNKGFKDPASVVDAYRNFEKLHGVPKERLLKLPEKSDDPSWNDIYNKLGRPEKPSEYQLPVPKGDKGEFAAKASEWFHEAGLTKAQAQAIANKMNEHVSENTQTQNETLKAQLDGQVQSLQKEWGQHFDQKLGAAKAAAKEFGISGEMLDKMESMLGYPEVMKLMHSIGTRLGEAEFVSGNTRETGFSTASPQAALNRINALKSDPDFVRRYAAGEANAKAEFNALHKKAYPEVFDV